MTETPQSRKPIYDDALPLPSTDSSQLTLHPKPVSPATPTDRLSTLIRRARLSLHAQATELEEAANRSLDKAFDMEHTLSRTVASLAPPRDSAEKVMPGGIYVLVAAMGASVLTRNRNFVLRAVAPLAVGLGAANYVLPVTSANVGRLVWRWEQKVPVVADAHARTQERVTRFVRTGIEHSKMSGDMLSHKVGELRQGIQDWVRKGR